MGLQLNACFFTTQPFVVKETVLIRRLSWHWAKLCIAGVSQNFWPNTENRPNLGMSFLVCLAKKKFTDQWAEQLWRFFSIFRASFFTTRSGWFIKRRNVPRSFLSSREKRVDSSNTLYCPRRVIELWGLFLNYRTWHNFTKNVNYNNYEDRCYTNRVWLQLICLLNSFPKLFSCKHIFVCSDWIKNYASHWHRLKPVATNKNNWRGENK